jgi:signal transduction histidine kinase
VQAIAEAHHGSARASSTLGQGSVFEVLLPAAPAPAETPAEPEPVMVQMSRLDADPAT